MTDFIESTNTDSSYAVYSEEYLWAEECSEYYNEYSENHLQPTFDSSDFQFFGEACFIQEASRRSLIAGGILSLISGALFMIIKLLKGGGGGGGGSSSSRSSSRSSSSSSSPKSGGTNSSSAAQRKNNSNEAAEAAAREMEAREREREAAEEAAARERDAKWREQEAAMEREERQREQEAAKERETRQRERDRYESLRSKPLDELRTLRNSDGDNVSKIIEDRVKAANDYLRYRQKIGDDAPEHRSYDAKFVLNRLKKLKDLGAGRLKFKGGMGRINGMINCLKTIDNIVDTLNGMIDENRWALFSHEANEDVKKLKGDEKRFVETYASLNENLAKLHEFRAGSSDDKIEEIGIDAMMSFIKDVKDITDTIDKKCRDGMGKCKTEHRKRNELARKMIMDGKPAPSDDLAEVKKAYGIFNRILKEIYKFEQNLETMKNDFVSPSNYINNKAIPICKDKYLRDLMRLHIIRMGTYNSIEHDSIKDLLDDLFGMRPTNAAKKRFEDNMGKGAKMPKNHLSDDQMEDRVRSFLMVDMSFITRLSQVPHYTDFLNNPENLFEIGRKNEALPAIKNARDIATNTGGDYPELQEYLIKTFNQLEEFYSISFDDWAKYESIDDNPIGKKTKEFWDDYVIDINVCNDVAKKTVERYNSDKMDDVYSGKGGSGSHSKDTPVNEFFKLVGDNIGHLEGVLPDYELSKFKEAYQKANSDFNNDRSDEEDHMNKVFAAIEKYVYGSDSKVGDEEWKKIESFLETIGFKSAGLSAGDKITSANRSLFARPIPASTDDSSKHMTIKQIQQQPRILKIEVDGKMETYKLAGKCTVWMRPVGGKDTRRSKDEHDKDLENAYIEDVLRYF